mgnify:CR=1 FL=1
MGLNMTVEFALAIVVGAAFACYLVWKWQEAAVDNMADPPYQEPVKPKADMVEQWVEATKQAEDKLEPTPLNPTAAWPFPSGPKP